MKKSAVTLGGVGVAIIFIIKMASLANNYSKLSEDENKVEVKSYLDTSEKLTDAIGCYYNDSLQVWVENQNIIAPFSTTNLTKGRNFVWMQMVSFNINKAVYHALIYKFEDSATNNVEKQNKEPDKLKQRLQITLLTPSDYKQLKDFFTDEFAKTYSLKTMSSTTLRCNKEKDDENFVKKNICILINEPGMDGIGGNEYHNDLQHLMPSKLVLKKEKINGEQFVKFLVPQSFGDTKLEDEFDTKYFICPLNYFEKLIIP
jgi:hypothetical protein